MRNLNKMTKAELINEVEVLEQRFTELESRAEELEQTVSSLREGDLFLQAVFESLPFEVWVCDADGRYVLQNALDMAYWGDNTGKTVDELATWSEETLAQWDDGNRRALSGEQVREEDERFVNQELRYYSTFVSPVRAGDAILGIVGVNINTTERKQAEIALRSSEEKFSKAFHTSPDSININRLIDGMFIDINAGFSQVTGYPREEVIGKTSLEINIWANPEDRAALMETLQTRGEATNLEAAFRMKDGTEKVGLMSATIVEINGEQCILSITRDISKRKQMEQELRESEERYRLLAENSPTGIVLHRDDRIFYANRAVADLYGISDPGELIGRHILDFVHPDYKPIVLERSKLLREQSEMVPLLEEKFFRLDGSSIDVEVAAVPFMFQGEQTVQVIINDITERKQAQELIRLRLSLMEYAATHSLEELLRNTLDEIGKLTNSPIGFFHFVEEDQQTLSLQTWSTRTLNEFCEADGERLHYPVGQAGIWADCIREKQPVIHNDYQSLSQRKGLPDGHAQVVRELVVPISRGGRIVAILGIGNKPQDYTEKDVELVSYLADVAWEIIERQRAEEALRESEEKFRSIVENALAGIFTVDHAYQFIYVNDELCNILGYSEEQLLGMDFRKVLTNESRELVSERYIRRQRGEDVPARYEMSIIRGDGELRYAEMSVTVVKDKMGNSISMGQLVDITERKRTRQELEDTKILLEATFEQTPVPMVLVSTPDGVVQIANSDAMRFLTGDDNPVPVGQSLFGYKPSWQDFDSEGRPIPLSETPLALALRGITTRSKEHSVLRKDGTRRWDLASAAPIYNAVGEQIAAFVTFPEITDLKRTEEALRESEFFLRKSQAVARLGSYYFDAITGTWICSPALDEIFGIDDSFPKDIDGWISLVHPEQKEEILHYFSQYVLAGHNRFDKEYRIIRHDDQQVRWMHGLGELEFDESGKAVKMIGTIQDITERKQVQDELRKKTEELDQFFNVALDLLCIADTNGYFLRLNPQWGVVLGYSLSELEGQSIFDLIHSDDQDSTLAALGELGGQKAILNFTNRYRCKDGSYRWLEWRSYPVGNLVYAAARDITDRRQTEEALRISEERLRQVIRVSRIGIFDHDFVNDTMYMSPEYREMREWGPTETVTLPMLIQQVYPDDRKRFEESISRAHDPESDGYYDIEYRIVRRDGTIRWIVARAQTFFDGEGSARQPVRTVGAVLDVTESRQIEEALRLTRFTVENVADAVFWINPQAQIVDVNEAARRSLGYSREELIGMSLSEIDPRFSLAQWPDTWKRLKRDRKLTRETQHQTKNGQLFSVEVVANYIDFGGRELDCAVVRDITERKQAEEALRASMTQIQTIINGAPLILFSFDQDGNFTFLEGKALRHEGRSPSEVIGKSAFDVFRERPDLCGYIRRAMGGESFTVNTFIDERRYDIYHAPLFDDEGRCVGATGVSMDVTERDRAEEKIHRLNEELEERVVERTAQLEAANKELEAFSYSVSHDLRAPLRAIDGFSRILIEDHAPQLPGEVTRLLGIVRSNTQQMGRLIDGLLAFSRLSRQPVDKRAVNTGDLVLQVLNMLQGDLEGREVKIEVGDLPVCQGDPMLLKQVWMNLLSNALKFTREREVARIEIGCEEGDEEQVYYVKDNGVGFDMQYVDKMFGVFQRLHRDEKFEGTGVGLAIVQRIVHRHDGRVWVEGEVDRGATFYFSLPQEMS